jgi:hypothetical protein
MRIYLQFTPGLQGAIPGTCYANLVGSPGDPTHPGCGIVKRAIVARQLTAEIKTLQRHLDVEVPDRRRQITQDHHDCLRDASGRASLDTGRDGGAAAASAGMNAKVIPGDTKDDGAASAAPTFVAPAKDDH